MNQSIYTILLFCQDSAIDERKCITLGYFHRLELWLKGIQLWEVHCRGLNIISVTFKSCLLCFTVIPPHGLPVPKSLVLSSSWQLLEAGADSSLQRKKRQSQDFLQPYIAAKLDSLPEIFTLGDEKTYNGYYNKPLPGQQQYRCFVLADLMDHESVSAVYWPLCI